MDITHVLYLVLIAVGISFIFIAGVLYFSAGLLPLLNHSKYKNKIVN